MKTIKTKEIMQSNGIIRIEVENTDYDTMYDQCTLETECANNTQLLLTNIFKL
jgi:hypothetical protein